MNKALKCAFLLVIGVLLLINTANAQNVTPANMNVLIDQTNFMVNGGCSGSLIDAKEGYILTAEHCVTNQYKTFEKESFDENGVVKKEKVRRLVDGTVSQYEYRGSESVRTVTYKVKLIATDKDTDLALLQIKANIPNTISSKFACEEPARLDRVYIVGNPTGVLYSSVTTGIVSSIQRDYDLLSFQNNDAADGKKPLMQISGGIVGGNSGGAIYNVRGEMIGVPVLGHRTNEVLGFAVPLESIKSFLKLHKLERLFSHCERTGDVD